MFFGNDDDEGDFMAPGGSSKLASLFDLGAVEAEDKNTSLKYTAPKEPKKKKPGESDDAKQQGSTKVLNAVAVHAYKYVDGKYEAQGKLGAAILGDQETMEYKVLLYKTKQQPVTQARITPAFIFTVQENNYATMYDDSRLTWSLNFDSAANLQAFAKQICVAKAGSGKDSLPSVVSQITVYGEGGSVENGDSLEISYEAWNYESSQIGQSIDVSATASNTPRFKLGRGKVIKAFDEGLVGVRRGSKCVLIVPPSQGTMPEVKAKVNNNTVVVYEVTVLRVKINKEREAAPQPETDSHEPSPAHTPQPQEAEGPDKPAAVSSDKAKLISRMAKMGKPMLPVTAVPDQQTDAHTDDGDRTPEDIASTSPPMKPNIASKPRVQPHQSASHPTTHHTTQPHPHVQQVPAAEYYQPPPQQVFHQQAQAPVASQLALYQTPMQMPMYGGPYGPQPPPQYGQMYAPPQPQYAPQAPTPPPSSGSDVVLAESRQHNTELRMSLNKLTEKVDRVYEKVESVNHQQLQTSSSSMPNMEAGVLLHNITRIVQENERLRQDLYDKNNKIENQNEKINELIQSNQRYIEQSNMMLEQRSDTFKQTATDTQGRVLALEQDKVKITSELSMSISQISALQLDVTALKKRELELKQQLDSLLVSDQDQKTELATLRVSNTDNGNRVEQLSTQLKEEKRGRKDVETRLTTLQEEHAELSNTLHGTDKVEHAELSNTLQGTDKALADRKRKSAEERQKLEQELEEIKSGLETEIVVLKEKLKKERSSTDVTTAEKISKVEEDLTTEWKEKSERLLAATSERHKRALAEVEDEKTQLAEKVQVLEKKVSDMKSSRGVSADQVSQLRDELDDMKVWKDKYESVREQAAVMKERYEGRVREVEGEAEAVQGEKRAIIEKARAAQSHLQAELLSAKDQVSELQSDIENLRQQKPSSGGPAGSSAGKMDKETLNTEVKKIMSSVYGSIRREFEAGEEYSGAAVQQTVLNTIKSVTLNMLSSNKEVKGQEEGQEEDQEEESEEESSSEEEDDVEEEDINQSEDNKHINSQSNFTKQISNDDKSENSQSTSETKTLNNDKAEIYIDQSEVVEIKNDDNQKSDENSSVPIKNSSNMAKNKIEAEQTGDLEHSDNKIVEENSARESSTGHLKEAAVESSDSDSFVHVPGGGSNQDDASGSDSGDVVATQALLQKDKRTEVLGSPVQVAVTPQTGRTGGNPHYAQALEDTETQEETTDAEVLEESSHITTSASHITTGESPASHITTGESPDSHITTGESPDSHITTGESPDSHITTGESPANEQEASNEQQQGEDSDESSDFKDASEEIKSDEAHSSDEHIPESEPTEGGDDPNKTDSKTENTSYAVDDIDNKTNDLEKTDTVTEVTDTLEETGSSTDTFHEETKQEVVDSKSNESSSETNESAKEADESSKIVEESSSTKTDDVNHESAEISEPMKSEDTSKENHDSAAVSEPIENEDTSDSDDVTEDVIQSKNNTEQSSQEGDENKMAANEPDQQSELLRSLPKSGVSSDSHVSAMKKPVFKALQESDSEEDLFKPLPPRDSQKSSAAVELDSDQSEEDEESADQSKQVPKQEGEDPLFGGATVVTKPAARRSTTPAKSSAAATPQAKSLFGDDGDDDDSDDNFFKPVTKSSVKNSEKKTSVVRKSVKKEDSDSDDLREKPPPPPLFGDDDDEDSDLDWFSKS